VPVFFFALTTEAMEPLAHLITKCHGPHPLYMKSIAQIMLLCSRARV
jgi:hypothetical protein